MFVTYNQRSNIARISTMVLLAIGILFSGVFGNSAQAGRTETVKIKKATTNFNRKVRIKKSVVRKTRSRRVVTYNKTRRALSRTKKSSLRRLPSKRKLTGQRARSYRGLHPRLSRLLVAVRRHYGKPIVVSSGCRSYKRNRRVGGAKRSLHLSCKAADFKVVGVSKASLRRYVSKLAGRGGVGTYCGRSIVHLDVGPVRSWYQGCGKRRRLRKS